MLHTTKQKRLEKVKFSRLKLIRRKRSVQRPISSEFFYNLNKLSRSRDCYSTSSYYESTAAKSNGLDFKSGRERERREFTESLSGAQRALATLIFMLLMRSGVRTFCYCLSMIYLRSYILLTSN